MLLLQKKIKARQLGASRPGKGQRLPRAYGAVCAHAIPAMVLLYARGTADLGLFWQVFAVWELYFLCLSVFTLSLPTRGHLHQRVCKSVCKSPVQHYSSDFPDYKADWKTLVAF